MAQRTSAIVGDPRDPGDVRIGVYHAHVLECRSIKSVSGDILAMEEKLTVKK